MNAVFNKSFRMNEKLVNSDSVAAWPILLEKAMVKAVGGYKKLLESDFSVEDFLRNMTGAPNVEISPKSEKFEEVIQTSLD